MYIYKAYYWPKGQEFYYTKHPSSALLEKEIDEEYEDTDWEVKKIEVIDNKNGAT